MPTPHERLRAFEDEKLGADAPRISGKLENGHGSLFQRLSHEDKAHHAALERLIDATAKADKARAALAEAEGHLAAAQEKAGTEPEPIEADDPSMRRDN